MTNILSDYFMKTYSQYNKIFSLLLLLGSGSIAFAQNMQTTANQVVSPKDVLFVMGVTAIILLFLIVLLMAFPYIRKTSKDVVKVLAIGSLLSYISSQTVFAQTPVAADSTSTSAALQNVINNGITGDWSIFGIAYWSLYMLILVEAIIVAVIIGRYLYGFYEVSLQKQNEARLAKGKAAIGIWEKFNATVALEEEKDIQLDHNYDGIIELDNDLPPWWKYGFYATILFSCVYLWQYHVVRSKPLQLQELAIATAKGEEEVAEFLKKSANAIDENSVKELTDAGAISAGNGIFTKNCAVCHGQKGEGLVGPNFADNYWVYGGGIKDIFKTIKYGKVEKGMKSWKEELSPLQMAQVASYIRTFKGTNPPNQKEAQGTLYEEGATGAADSTAAKVDTTKAK